MGRIVLVLTGAILIAVAGIYAYHSPNENVVAVTSAFVVGIAQVVMAIGASDRVCAFFGFFAPWWP